MKLESLLRHVADNVEAGRHTVHGLLLNGETAFQGELGVLDIIWSVSDNYEIAPETHTVNGFEVAMPISVQPSERDTIFISSIENTHHYTVALWTGANYDYRLFNRGLLFATLEDAEANAKAMLGIDPDEEC